MKFGRLKPQNPLKQVANNTLSLLAPILRKSVVRKVKAGDIIFYQGEEPQSACILKEGVVKVYNIISSGEEQLVNFQIPHEVFPTPWLFNKAPSVLYFYEAVTDCEMYLIACEDFTRFIKSNKRAMSFFLDYYVNNYIGAVMRITALEQPKARERIMYTMYFLAQRYGEKSSEGSVKIRLKLTHQHIASLVGLTRETTAVEMKKLKETKVVHYVQQQYVVRMNKLLEMMGEENFKDLDI